MVINETLTQEEVDEFRRIQKSKYLNQLDREKRSTIETDIYHPSSIRKVKNHMKVKEISSFDLIVCKPAGPFAALKRNAINLPGLQSLFTNLLNKYYELLSNQEGMMFLQLPVGIFKSEEVKSWVENNKNESLKIEFDEEKKALKIVKLYGAPENLNFVSMAA
jgi:hypothetical protein